MLSVWPSVDRRVDALQEADVLVGEEHVDEAAQPAGLVEEALGETGVRALERLQRLGDGRRLDLTPRPRRRRGCAAAWGSEP